MLHKGENRPYCFKSLRFGFLFLLLVALLSLSWLIQPVAAWITFRIQQGTWEGPSLVSFLWSGTFRRDTFSYRFCVVLQGFPMESEMRLQPCSWSIELESSFCWTRILFLWSKRATLGLCLLSDPQLVCAGKNYWCEVCLRSGTALWSTTQAT